jgi:hypothetical protein
MIYRKQPAHPPRLLLRIVGTAGASTLLGMAACSSSSNPDHAFVGSAGIVEHDGGDSDADPALVGGGSQANPCISSDVDGACSIQPLGSIAQPADASDLDGSFADAGNDGNDAAAQGDASMFHGLVTHPEDAAAQDAADDVHVVNGLVVNPGDSE